jgi:hypothetical protein
MSDKALLGISIAVLLCVAIFGGGLVMSGLVCGVLTAMGFALLALKSRSVREFSRRHPLLVDVIGSVGGYLLFPSGVIAFIGAGVVAIMLTGLISLDRLLHGVPEKPRRMTITQRMAKNPSLLEKIQHRCP